MLNAIELYGFKSFADKTRLEFGEGISAVVGPNGSGKSNIVDAIKWVLGEQSVKKLRGNEMTDVIFSGSAGRQACGTAEVTLSFDNSRRIFDLDTPEVHISRRIYRSGEGEYLINRQPSRLKDVKDLLGGTGLGTQAYSIIEQGRVESLLQSSSVQRRTIFEEAAGISRFNAKKQEVQRRLERVDQNLIRLSDIVGEVENQLKTVKSQAGKAQLYRQYTARLQELRIQASLVDWRKYADRLRSLQDELDSLTHAEKEAAESLEQLEQTGLQNSSLIEGANQQLGKIEGELLAVKERIAGEEANIELHFAQVQQLEAEITQLGRQLVDLNVRSVDTDGMMRKAEEEIRGARQFHAEIGASYEQNLAVSEQLSAKCKEKQAECDRLRKELEAKHREISRKSGELNGLESRVQTLREGKEQSEARLIVCERQRKEMLAQLDQLREKQADSVDRITQFKEQLESVRRQKTQRAESLSRHLQELSDSKQRLSAMSERITVLEELLQRHEGLSPGVKEVIRQSRQPESPFRFVHGLVADLFRVDVEAAPLIELALGPSAQYIVVSPEPELFRHIERTSHQFAGRVGFIWLDTNSVEIPWVKGNGFDGRKGVIGRADRFVQTDTAIVHLAQRLLGRTWIVENITVAKSLYRESDDRTNFLTVGGEYLAADGTIVVGPLSGTSGVITRRSELRTLAEQLTILQSQIQEKEIAITVQRNRLSEEEKQFEDATKELQNVLSRVESQGIMIKTAEERLAQNETQFAELRLESETIDAQWETATRQWDDAVREKEELEAGIANIDSQAAAASLERDSCEKEFRDHTRKTTNVKIELAKSEERLDFLKDRIRQFENHQQERQHLLAEHQQRIQSLVRRREQALLSILRFESNIASLFLRKETLSENVKALHSERTRIDATRNHAQNDLKKIQQEWNRIRNKLHAKQLEYERILQERKTLADRIRDDYRIELEELEKERLSNDRADRNESEETNDANPENDANLKNETAPENDAAPAATSTADSSEIEELRIKIQKLGGVNLDAIETLESLETRYTTLSNQYQDLTNAKKSIEKIIEKINLDSQRLFEETFQGVKGHFQELFQQLFGGGHADLVLEDESNLLESGVDIIARPPGKELKSVSLLSGGEKTLTCVALLLAFFRFRPNPVCILDEVDAALDEGNIDRFVRMVKEFRTDTQFLIITHSKKTMSCASTMYGITMQESGVSKPISVRFIDVGENGEILDTAENRKEHGQEIENQTDEAPLHFSIDSPPAHPRAA